MKDRVGNAMPEDHVWSFQTTADHASAAAAAGRAPTPGPSPGPVAAAAAAAGAAPGRDKES